MNILDIINNIDLDLLKEQGTAVNNIIVGFECRLDSIKQDGGFIGEKDEIEWNLETLKGVLELIDNLVIALENT